MLKKIKKFVWWLLRYMSIPGQMLDFQLQLLKQALCGIGKLRLIGTFFDFNGFILVLLVLRVLMVLLFFGVLLVLLVVGHSH
jgi:hypothetical protein